MTIDQLKAALDSLGLPGDAEVVWQEPETCGPTILVSGVEVWHYGSLDDQGNWAERPAAGIVLAAEEYLWFYQD